MKKNNIFRLFAALLMGYAFLAVSCKDSGDDTTPKEDPSFPSLVENYNVQPGETLVLTFTPNYDWTVSVPAELRQWFWIQDGSFSVSEVSGKASESVVVVNVGVTENQEFDRNFSCEVSMTMDGRTEVIAKYMLPAKERTMAIYAAEWNEDGSLKVAEDGESYVYASEVTEKLELKWSAADAEFRAPVKVEANCQWDVVVPEWAEVNVPENSIGMVEVVFSGESVDAMDGKLVFKAGDEVLKEISVSVPSCNDIDVYSALMSEGEFEYGEDGDYAWSADPIENVSLAWLGADFRMPVKVDAKCNWDIELPEWLKVEVPEKTAGTVALTLLGVPSKYPLVDTEGKIRFKLGDKTLKELDVFIPGCMDIMSFGIDMSLTALEYNYIGEINTSTGYIEGPATGHLTGIKDVRVFSVETTGGKVGAENPDWFTIEMSGWNTAAGADVIQERELSFSVAENEGDARSAVLFVLPPSVKNESEELFNPDATVKDEYASYAVIVTQASMNYDEYLAVNVNADAEFAYSLERASAEKTAELAAEYGATEFVYVLTYESPYCRDDAYMTMAIPFESYKVFGDGEWLSYSNAGDANNYGVIDMYKEAKLPYEPQTGYVVFYNSEDAVLAIVECVSPYIPEEMSLDMSSMTFASDASSFDFAVTSNTDWTVESDADWCTVSPASGSNDGTVTVSVTENEADEVRKAVITVKSYTLTQTLSVEQKLGEVLEVSASAVEFDYDAATHNVTVASNVAWTVESDADWCTVTPASGTGAGTVTVSVDRNIEDAVRTAVLTFRSESMTATVNVSQNYDDGSLTNGDETVHFVDWRAAKAAGATLERLKSGPIYREYRNGSTPIYHLTYTDASAPLRITLPAEVAEHNVNPWTYKECFRVNDVIYYDESTEVYSKDVVMDADGSVAIHMYMPEGKTSVRGNINFTNSSTDGPVIILVCTLDLTAE